MPVTVAPIISPLSRRLLREYFHGTTLSIIDDSFTDAGISCDESFVSSASGMRKSRVDQYYHTLDFSVQEDARRFLMVYQGALLHLESFGGTDEYRQRELYRMKAAIRQDGYEYSDGRLVSVVGIANAAHLKGVAAQVDAPNLARQIERIESQIDVDPRLAIGTAKELIETVCKTILGERGVEFDPKGDLSPLVKLTREQLKLVPEDIPDAVKGADAIRKILGSLTTITYGLAELRNSFGTGHGPDGKAKGLQPRHARLAAGAACTLAKFLFETHEHHS